MNFETGTCISVDIIAYILPDGTYIFSAYRLNIKTRKFQTNLHKQTKCTECKNNIIYINAK